MDELNVKAGDKVIVRCPAYGIRRVETVDKVTPTGRIKVNSTYFNKAGCEIGGNVWHRSHIVKATESEIKEIEQAEIIRGALYQLHNLSTLTYEQAVLIKSILEGGNDNG